MIDEITSLNKKNTILNSLADCIKHICYKVPEHKALVDKYSKISLTFGELNNEIDIIAGGLQALGLQKGEKVSLFSENNARWMIFDQAILRCGGVDAVRGSKAPIEELEYIIEHSDSVGVVLYDYSLYKKLENKIKNSSLKFVVIMFCENSTEDSSSIVYTYDQLREKGLSNKFTPVDVRPEDEATLIYTSGTTSKPKGVVLTHANLMSQLVNLNACFAPKPGETYLCILPIWHSYERSVAYFFFSRGTTLIYTNIKNIKSDMAKYQVTYIVGVPRIWESIASNVVNTTKNKSKLVYKILTPALKISKINRKSLRYLNRADIHVKQYNFMSDIIKAFIFGCTLPFHILFRKLIYKRLIKKFGIGLRAGISGGGALAPAYSEFFEALGVNLYVGYGLTETSPILTMNSAYFPNVLYSVGKPIPNTLIKIKDLNTNEELPLYTKGVVWVKGPQIMKGYYKNAEATKQVLTNDGWFNTGDIGWMNERNDLVLTGRQKEIIVLSNGENIEPVPIENACLKSDFIDQIMVVGQDRASLGALIVLNNVAYEQFLNKKNVSETEKETLNTTKDFVNFIKKEITSIMKTQTHLRSFERISNIAILKDAFTVQNGMLTMTSKMRRNVIADHYNDIINSLYK